MNTQASIDRAIELSERIEVLSKAALDGHRKNDVGDLMLNDADAEVAIFIIIDLVRNQKQILTAIPESQ